jgi:hypothetical protein
LGEPAVRIEHAGARIARASPAATTFNKRARDERVRDRRVRD